MEAGDDAHWTISASARAKRTVNPLRKFAFELPAKPAAGKTLLRLSDGDPTLGSNIRVSEPVTDALVELLRSGAANGYSQTQGAAPAREAVARHYAVRCGRAIDANRVFITVGASGALELALSALADDGDNVLLPSPGFAVYRALLGHLGVTPRFYALDPARGWALPDAAALRSLVDGRTRAIVVNNPSNPVGAVWTPAQLRDVLATARALALPVISDEVYGETVFSAAAFAPLARAGDDVPVFEVSAASKRSSVPGWRVGWLIAHDDRSGALERGGVIDGLHALSTRVLHAATPAQLLLPQLLADDESPRAAVAELEKNAALCVERIDQIPGVRCAHAPRAGMFLMVDIDVERLGVRDASHFVELLVGEEALLLLPGYCFERENSVRIAFSKPADVLNEAMDRLEAFCKRRIG